MAGMQPIGQEHAQPYGNEGTWEAPEAAYQEQQSEY